MITLKEVRTTLLCDHLERSIGYPSVSDHPKRRNDHCAVNDHSERSEDHPSVSQFSKSKYPDNFPSKSVHDPQDVICNINGKYNLRQCDLFMLKDGEWLNDKVCFIYLIVLVNTGIYIAASN